jgi:hypothetical protein
MARLLEEALSPRFPAEVLVETEREEAAARVRLTTGFRRLLLLNGPSDETQS